MGFLSDIKNKITGKKDSKKFLDGFSKTNKAIKSKIKVILDNNDIFDGNFIESLMVALIESDVGYKTSDKLCKLFSEKIKKINTISKNDVLEILSEVIRDNYNFDDTSLKINENGTTVILLVGVNGVGKTSTAAKLANLFKKNNKSVCLAAGDTFRAGAVEQLKKHADDLNVSFISGNLNEDPSSVFVNACRYCKENKIDYLICDTAGRLQNKTNLMKELEKVKRVIGKEIEGAPHSTLLVIDANTGQNGLSQAQTFKEVTDVNGIILTKTDGTSKGGIILGINDQLNIPVKYLTLGEAIDDINEFNLDLYIYSMLGDFDEH